MEGRPFRSMDLPALVFALQKALEFVYTTPIPGQEDEEKKETPFCGSIEKDVRGISVFETRAEGDKEGHRCLKSLLEGDMNHPSTCWRRVRCWRGRLTRRSHSERYTHFRVEAQFGPVCIHGAFWIVLASRAVRAMRSPKHAPMIFPNPPPFFLDK